MPLPILIEPVANNGYRATTGAPLNLVAEGQTREEAAARLRGLVDARLAAGAEVRTLDLPGADNPWVKHAGMFKDDPMFDEVIEIMKENRRRLDADEATL